LPFEGLYCDILYIWTFIMKCIPAAWLVIQT
jgi:hypothetical protein